ncbi:uncharacterized protein LOC124606730 [Schistocerca americana]|uniref:uncharacterized protein LOC124606730 n=1 Tax=Schistocerca americana TaxID=7009 RepID=UPI001F5021B0|nr:uncharacterized protein LOC124606730 [Schistocerca americana]
MDLAEIDRNAPAKLQAIQQLCSINEQLEYERNSILRPTPIGPFLGELLSATEYIHVGWLFSPAGKYICGELSLALDDRTPGWQDLATELGISLKLIMAIKHDYKLQEGPTYAILCIYARQDGATIGKVLEALHSIKRYDVLLELKEYIIGEKGLIKLLQSEAERWNELHKIPSDAHSFFSKPQLPPLSIKYEIFSTSDTVQTYNFSENISERPFCSERMATRSFIKSEENCVKDMIRPKRTRYKAIVMLTFSVDGFSCAKSIASALRKKRIGVLILDEHRNRLVSNPELFITEFFPQVNYVIPIVTKGYLDALTAESLTEGPLTSCIDARYVKLIYTLMVNQYIKSGCINLKVRCIIPDGCEWLMQEHPVVCNRPVLQAWLPEDEIEVLADSILSTSRPHSEE